jgi:hypothetical protein
MKRSAPAMFKPAASPKLPKLEADSNIDKERLKQVLSTI